MNVQTRRVASTLEGESLKFYLNAEDIKFSVPP